jgi:hypothetical protein
MTQIKPIGMRCNKEQFNVIKPKLEQAGFKIRLEFSPTCYPYLVNNYSGRTKEVACVYGSTVHDSEYNRTVFEKWNEQTFLEYCGIESKEPIKQEQMTKYKNYTVPATDVLKIRAIACRTWKDNLTGYLREMDDNNNVTFSEEQIDAMFNAATDTQRPVLVEIFGEPKPVFIPKEGDLVWCWDRDNTFPKVGVYHTYDGTDMPYKVGNSWWNCVAPFNNGQIPEEWLKKFEEQKTAFQL